MCSYKSNRWDYLYGKDWLSDYPVIKNLSDETKLMDYFYGKGCQA